MNKVKCVNGHFYDADRFGCCPICGGAAGTAAMPQSKKPVEPSRMSRMDPVDKTAILAEDEAPVAPATGKMGGIKWRFGGSKVQEPVSEKPAPVSVKQPAQDTAQEEPREEAEVSVQRDPVSQKAAFQTVSAPIQDAVGSQLSQAVAATGHGVFSALPKTVAYYDMEETVPPTGWIVCVKGAYQGQAFPCKTGRNKIGRNPDCDVNLMNDASVTREPHAIIIYDPKNRAFYLQNGTGDGLVYLNDALLFTHEPLHAYDRIMLGNAEFLFIPLCGEKFTWDDYIS